MSQMILEMGNYEFFIVVLYPKMVRSKNRQHAKKYNSQKPTKRKYRQHANHARNRVKDHA